MGARCSTGCGPGGTGRTFVAFDVLSIDGEDPTRAAAARAQAPAPHFRLELFAILGGQRRSTARRDNHPIVLPRKKAISAPSGRVADVVFGIDEVAIGDGEFINLCAQALVFVAAGARGVQFLKEESDALDQRPFRQVPRWRGHERQIRKVWTRKRMRATERLCRSRTRERNHRSADDAQRQAARIPRSATIAIATSLVELASLQKLNQIVVSFQARRLWPGAWIGRQSCGVNVVSAVKR
jgi:hypothetical protein